MGIQDYIFDIRAELEEKSTPSMVEAFDELMLYMNAIDEERAFHKSKVNRIRDGAHAVKEIFDMT